MTTIGQTLAIALDSESTVEFHVHHVHNDTISVRIGDLPWQNPVYLRGTPEDFERFAEQLIAVAAEENDRRARERLATLEDALDASHETANQGADDDGSVQDGSGEAGETTPLAGPLDAGEPQGAGAPITSPAEPEETPVTEGEAVAGDTAADLPQDRSAVERHRYGQLCTCGHRRAGHLEFGIGACIATECGCSSFELGTDNGGSELT